MIYKSLGNNELKILCIREEEENENANSHHKLLLLMQRHIYYDKIYPLMKSIEMLSSSKNEREYLCHLLFHLYRHICTYANQHVQILEIIF